MLTTNEVPKSIDLSQEQRDRIKKTWNPEKKTLNEHMHDVLDLGLSTLEWRKDSYEKNKETAKLARKALKYARGNPEAAKAIGLAKEGDGSTGFQRA